MWTFRIRADAAFWDGRSVSARDVANGWAANAEGSPRAAETFARIGVQGARTLHVELHRPARYAHLFAHPDFAVARRDAGATWPIGSGPFRIDTHADGARREKLSLEATGDASATPRSIELEIVTGPDPRRALDAGADVLVSSDAAVLRYARALPEYTAEPLTWSRTYVLATRARTASAERLTMPPREAQLALARDAVRADVRPAQPSPWAERADCPLDPAAQAGPPAAARRRDAIAYPRDDAIARGIAERLVALAWPSARAPTWLRALRPDTADDAPTALALDDAALLEALREDVAAAFVLPISRAVADACGELTPADPALARDPLSAGEWRLVPLLDGRDHIIHRRGIGTLTLDADGAVRFARARP